MAELMTAEVGAGAVSAKTLSKNAGMIRRAAEANEIIPVTFHGRPMSRVVPDARWQQIQDDLAAAHKQIERLRAALLARGVEPEEVAVA